MYCSLSTSSQVFPEKFSYVLEFKLALSGGDSVSYESFLQWLKTTLRHNRGYLIWDIAIAFNIILFKPMMKTQATCIETSRVVSGQPRVSWLKQKHGPQCKPSQKVHTLPVVQRELAHWLPLSIMRFRVSSSFNAKAACSSSHPLTPPWILN